MSEDAASPLVWLAFLVGVPLSMLLAIVLMEVSFSSADRLCEWLAELWSKIDP